MLKLKAYPGKLLGISCLYTNEHPLGLEEILEKVQDENDGRFEFEKEKDFKYLLKITTQPDAMQAIEDEEMEEMGLEAGDEPDMPVVEITMDVYKLEGSEDTYGLAFREKEKSVDPFTYNKAFMNIVDYFGDFADEE